MNRLQLSIDSLHHQIKNNIILNNISLKFDGFQSVTLLGPNGAGKSTLMKVIAANLYCQSGFVRLNSVDSENERFNYLDLIGYMPEDPMIIPELSVLEQLQLMAHCKQIKNKQNAIDSVIETCQLQQVCRKKTAQLSLGYKQRLNLAQALLNQPLVLIMDEPLNGLDPHLIIKFRHIINELKKTTLTIVSTHYLAEAQKISDRIVIMQNGKVLDNIKIDDTHEANQIEEIYMQHTSSQ